MEKCAKLSALLSTRRDLREMMDWSEIVQTCPNLSENNSTCLKWIKLVQSYSNWSILIQIELVCLTFSSFLNLFLSKLVQICLILMYKLELELFKHD